MAFTWLYLGEEEQRGEKVRGEGERGNRRCTEMVGGGTGVTCPSGVQNLEPSGLMSGFRLCSPAGSS